MQTRYRTTDFDLVSGLPMTKLCRYLDATDLHTIAEFQDERGRWHATFEIISADDFSRHETAEVTIKAILDIMEHLPPEERILMERCEEREFNTAYDLGTEPRDFNEGLSAETLQRVSALGISLRVTLYPGAEV